MSACRLSARAVGTVLDWPVDHVGGRRRTGRRHGRRHRGRARPGVPARLGDQAARGLRRARSRSRRARSTGTRRPGPDGSTVRHLAAHASGLSFTEGKVQAKPGTRRIYSNAGFEVLGEAVAAGGGHAVRRVPRRGGAPPAGHGRHPARRLARRGRRAPPRRTWPGSPPSCRRPRSSVADTLPRPPPSRSPAWTASCPASAGRSPTTGGWASRSATASRPHWTGADSSPRTFGHFGQSRHVPVGGSRTPARRAVVLTDRDFGAVGDRGVAASGPTGCSRPSSESAAVIDDTCCRVPC